MEAIESNPSYYTKEEVNRLIEKMIIISGLANENGKCVPTLFACQDYASFHFILIKILEFKHNGFNLNGLSLLLLQSH